MNKKNKFKMNSYIWIAITSTAILSFVLFTSLGRYVWQEKSDPHAKESSAFYFESEILKEDEKEYTISDWTDEPKTIDIDLKNYANTLLVSNDNIDYKISFTAKINGNAINANEVTITLDGSNASEITNTLNAEILTTEVHTIKVVANNVSEGDILTIDVVATSNVPYQKTMKGTFTLIQGRNENVEKELVTAENNQYVTLNLKVNVATDIQIKYDSERLILDKSEQAVNKVSVNTANSQYKFTLEEENLENGSNYEIRFIKIDENDIILGQDIIVTQ